MKDYRSVKMQTQSDTLAVALQLPPPTYDRVVLAISRMRLKEKVRAGSSVSVCALPRVDHNPCHPKHIYCTAT